MAKKNVTTIPATISRFTTAPINTRTKRRVGGYARVSTDMEDQQTSYTAQCDYYTNYIKSREDWEFVFLYSDEGISATSTQYRDGFKQMINDALAGKIDLIITKSVSRFARNTVDSLSTIRKLKESGVEVYFEKENIWTFDSKGELLITIMSSLAQEESRSISENCTWGVRKRFADGKVSVPFGRFLGYDRGEDGNLVINEEQAKVVRRIYGLFLQGKSPYMIAKQLTAESIPTPGGKKVWGKAVIESILTNEKYKGDALLQKVYTTDFLSHKKKINEGEVPQYYVEGNHEAIIAPPVFDKVQLLMKSRCKGKNRNSSVNIFSSKIKCGKCGSWYGSKVWHSNDKYRKVIWQCNHKYSDNEKCSTPHIDEKTVKERFIRAVNIYMVEKDAIIACLESLLAEIQDTSEAEFEKANLQNELVAIANTVQQCIADNAHFASNQDEYEKKYNELVDRYEDVQARISALDEQITRTLAEKETTAMYIEKLRSVPDTVTEFDDELWQGLLQYMTVYGKDDYGFTFADGTEIRI